MKISFNDLFIARGRAFREHPEGLRVVGEQNVQTYSTLRGTHLGVLNRQNLKTTLAFSLNKCHESAEAALQFSLTHAEALNGIQGDLTLEEEGSAKKHTLHQATLLSFTSTHNGLISQNEYVFVGGPLQTT
ncbi:MAG: hypothetical protein A2Y14_01835 [Verrucomicrobia bacterium GWF2_51_19]|nr:MAG: hypothetical protein A2Y14_01835 [Verrucomicrobia bacterium GWF2_51_19]HCJ11605.1 hypothetical protein [Opitutae bacterium]